MSEWGRRGEPSIHARHTCRTMVLRRTSLSGADAFFAGFALPISNPRSAPASPRRRPRWPPPSAQQDGRVPSGQMAGAHRGLVGGRRARDNRTRAPHISALMPCSPAPSSFDAPRDWLAAPHLWARGEHLLPRTPPASRDAPVLHTRAGPSPAQIWAPRVCSDNSWRTPGASRVQSPREARPLRPLPRPHQIRPGSMPGPPSRPPRSSTAFFSGAPNK